jgi:hypothetical protein
MYRLVSILDVQVLAITKLCNYIKSHILSPKYFKFSLNKLNRYYFGHLAPIQFSQGDSQSQSQSVFIILQRPMAHGTYKHIRQGVARRHNL